MAADASRPVFPRDLAAAVALSATVGFVWILVLDSLTFGVNLLALVYARRAAGLAPGPGGARDVGGWAVRAGWTSMRGIVARAPWLGWSAVPAGMIAGGWALTGVEYVAVGVAVALLGCTVAVRVTMRTSARARRGSATDPVEAS
ncbi:hypothetical protein NLM24_08390 [Nocardia zapadnayensis]|nr:hypothetical protein [Nocardia zapadnayensis]MCX0270723.1 hypothetical protein [Nocardia zapadnayensis]